MEQGDRPRKPHVPRETIGQNSASDLLHPDWVAERCPEASAGQCAQWANQLDSYTRLIRRWSARMNLISAGDQQHLIEKHVRPSLALRPMVRTVPRSTIWDVGSGAGFPGVPLAITLSESSFVLVESRRRRASFLREVVRQLELQRVQVLNVHLDSNQTTPAGMPRAEVVLSRAAMSPECLVRVTRGIASPHAVFISTLATGPTGATGCRQLLKTSWEGRFPGSAAMWTPSVDS